MNNKFMTHQKCFREFAEEGQRLADAAWLRVARAKAIDTLGPLYRGRARCAHPYTDSHGVQVREIWPEHDDRESSR